MGNCYSADSTQDIETSLQNKTLAKQKAHAGADQFKDGLKIDEGQDFEAQENETAIEVSGKLRDFLGSLQTS